MALSASEAENAFQHESIAVAGTAIGFTTTTITPTTGRPAVRAVLTFEDAQVRACWDGTTPTATVGHAFNPGDVFVLEGPNNLTHFLAIRTGGVSGTIRATYER